MNDPICAASDIPLNCSKPVEYQGESRLIFHLPEGFFATQSHCTHLFAPLKRGKVVDSCQVECPFHKARFDIKTGEVINWAKFPPGIQLLNPLRKEKALRTFAVIERDGLLYWS
jgi:3-phenylpropionate/trans-cinnamate dioxygenase ferredoxin subunit